MLPLYWPGQALRAPEGWGSQISRQSAHEGGKVVCPTHRLPLPEEEIPVAHFCQKLSRAHGHSWTERIMSVKNDSIRNEAATFRLVAQCLNQLRYCVFVKVHNQNQCFQIHQMIAVQEMLHINVKEAENCSPVVCFTAEAWNLTLRRLVWTGHVSHMGENKSTYRVSLGKQERRVPSARLWCRK